ncbi:hypothetical protein N7508_009193 [Penicillium antarcticum]|uniref:uncharacterized protein n=1 Tax=Penicillium antarcticum TaxID=416450 RepID=UPI0023A4E9D8|nr:uncharacterized protein N7508_009193 [Penicillium antarcticum]KAJ5294372.1 hypothetical protein N7508_009193 [Penicillium antarcticum]
MEAPQGPRRPTLRWEVRMRQVLCCLYRFFVCDKKQVMEIFSYLFRGHLQERGIRGFVPYATLHTQWSWMQNSGDPVWYHVHIATEFKMNAEWSGIIHEIKAAAEILRLRLQERTQDIELHEAKPDDNQHITVNSDPNNESANVNNKISFAWHEKEGELGSSGLKFYEYHGQPKTNCTTETIDCVDSGPKKPSQVLADDPQCRGLFENSESPHPLPIGELQDRDQSLECPDQKRTRGLSIDKPPPLLYRWWNIDSQGVNSKHEFVAGLFCNRPTFNPEDITDTEFLAFFRGHVTKQEVATPFISTFAFPLAPFHRALVNQKGAMVSIIESSKIPSKIFDAGPLAVKTRTFTGCWRGYAEYEVWGHIPAQAIVETLDINSVELIAQLHRDINRLLQPLLIRSFRRCNQDLRDILAIRHKGRSSFKCGLTLRKLLLLLRIPPAHWADLAPKFAHCWGWKYAAEKREFLEGVMSQNPVSQEEVSDSESEWVMPTPQATPKKGSKKSKSIELDEEDWEPLEYEEFQKVCSSLRPMPETSQKSPRGPFFYRGSTTPDKDWIPLEEEQDTEGQSESDGKANDASETHSVSMEERSDTTEETFLAETIDSMSVTYESDRLIEDHMALAWEAESIPEATQTGRPQDHNADHPVVHSFFVDLHDRDTDMDMNGVVSNEEDDPSAQNALDQEWPSEDDCPEMKILNRVRFR